MNLNNKYLAIGLSIAAVGILTYQIFFNEGATRSRRPSTHKPMIQSQSPAPTSQSPTTQPPVTGPASSEPPVIDPARQSPTGPPRDPGGDSDLVVDYNSEILLKRIPRELTGKFPRREITPEFGEAIFTRGVTEQEEKEETQSAPAKKVVFELNAIIMDRERRLTIINDTILKVGDVISGAKVIGIGKGKVVLNIENKNVILSTNSRVKQVWLIGGKGEH
ncbi:MAG: hypothetical protein GY940_20120 [bacterium]|nr:hypothetical protein [bacterium]